MRKNREKEKRNMRTFGLALAFAIGFAGLSFGEEGAVPSAKKQVFAHYMVCFFESVETYEYEIALAQRCGIDGFALNCGQWMLKDPKTGALTVPGNYVQAVERMYQAAQNLNSGFKLFISADMTGIRNNTPDVPDMIKRFYKHPNQFRHDGVPVFSTWAGRPEKFKEELRQLKAEGFPVVFVPAFQNFNRYSMRISKEAIIRLFNQNPEIDGFFTFIIDDSINGLIQSQANIALVAMVADKIYMGGNSPAYNSANLRDFQLGRGYGAIWEGIIRDGIIPWVELSTWNDYQEDSHVAPRLWGGMNREVQDHDETFLKLTEYYTKWFKTGAAPCIAQDMLFYGYRNRSKTNVSAWDFTLDMNNPQWLDITRDVTAGKLDQIHDDVQDRIYVTLFLTDNAVLEMTVGDQRHSFQVRSGVSTVDVPLVPGVPQFTLSRGGKKLLNMIGRRSIVGTSDKENSFQIEDHQMNRTWTGGGAVGEVQVFKAADAKLLPGTVPQGGAVQISEMNGGLTFAIVKPKAGTYSIRVRYKNSGSQDARLTMSATGSPMPVKERRHNPYRMPLFLPPTGNDFQTVGVYWSLFEKTDELSIISLAEPEKPGRSAELARLLGDRGSVLIDQVELVPVPDFVPQRKPYLEMIPIPGGTFTMGDKSGEPDESPAHTVTIASFAIARYEVTNEEYERFDPAHRQYRDGLSWRDREPVIYVSWRDIALYCNWLSKENSLDPVYDEKSFAVNLKANGFRMPTEAEWEYVATGRGENRSYPWGNEEPKPGVHGNFVGRAAVTEINSNLRSSLEQGVMVVGSYPVGASRDGVMDLAGNVGEWCADTYRPYPAVPQTNPLEQRPSHSRVIRGGTWDYYNHSQRPATGSSTAKAIPASPISGRAWHSPRMVTKKS